MSAAWRGDVDGGVVSMLIGGGVAVRMSRGVLYVVIAGDVGGWVLHVCVCVGACTGVRVLGQQRFRIWG